MDTNKRGDISTILEACRNDVPGAKEELFVLINDQLREMGRRLIEAERPGHLLQGSALANEAVRRLLGDNTLKRAEDRRDLFIAVTVSMRRILIDDYRKRPPLRQVDLSLAEGLEKGAGSVQLRLILDMDAAIEELLKAKERAGHVVIMKFFLDYSIDEMAEVLEVNAATVESDWRFARAWLQCRLGGYAE